MDHRKHVDEDEGKSSTGRIETRPRRYSEEKQLTEIVLESTMPVNNVDTALKEERCPGHSKVRLESSEAAKPLGIVATSARPQATNAE